MLAFFNCSAYNCQKNQQTTRIVNQTMNLQTDKPMLRTVAKMIEFIRSKCSRQKNGAPLLFLSINPLKWLQRAIQITFFLICLTACLWLSLLFFSSNESPPLVSPKTAHTLFTSFQQPPASYQNLDQHLFKLKKAANHSLPLPELKYDLIFYGYNDRPDCPSDKKRAFLSLKGQNEVSAYDIADPIYLAVEKIQGRLKYKFSPENAPTQVSLNLAQDEEKTTSQISLSDASNYRFLTPESSCFQLKQEPIPITSWKLSNHNVDNHLLTKMHTKWYGEDLFLKEHGGHEYNYAAGLQRIDFEEKEMLYSHFVCEGSCLVWNQDKWEKPQPNEHLSPLPMLQVKKIEDQLMSLQLWSADGKNKIALTLPKSASPAESSKIIHNFIYLGAKSWKEWIFEVQGKRVILRPQDWWLRTEKGWKKLTTQEEIDDYVLQKTKGELLVVEGMVCEKQKKMLRFTLFTSQRNQLHTIDLPIKQHQISDAPFGMKANHYQQQETS